jgi:hypothetical protein
LRHIVPFLFLLSAPAFVQAADTGGAEALIAVLARYIGTTAFDKGVVKITVQDDAYRVELDFDKLVSLLRIQDGLTLDIEPYVLSVKPRADATWDISGNPVPSGIIEIETENGSQTSEWQATDASFSGIYDPALAGFSTAAGKSGMISITTTDPASTSEFSAASGSFQTQSTRNAVRGVDFTALRTLSGVVQTMRFVVADSGSGLPIVLRSPELTYSSSATGFQSQALLDLLAFAVDHADEERMQAAQPQLKTMLRAALPLWENLSGAIDWREPSIGSPAGIFSAADARFAITMDGARKDGTISFGLEIDNLTVPAGLLPQWSAPLLPEDLDVNFGGTGFDLEGLATTAIEAIDLSRDPPPSEEAGGTIVDRLLDMPHKFLLNRSTISNKDTVLSASGEMTFVNGERTLTATVEIAGFDTAMQAIQAASATAPEAQQAYLIAAGVKGLAKTLSDGRLQWVVDMAPDGAVTINGTPVKPANAPAP